jgi:hypothetical protein
MEWITLFAQSYLITEIADYFQQRAINRRENPK